jgi:rhamnosyltransferase
MSQSTSWLVSANKGKKAKVVAIVVTHNPNPAVLKGLLASVAEQVNYTIVIDNASFNVELISKLCKDIGSCYLITMRFNSGVAHALSVGIKYASRYEPIWLLFLDQDAILMRNSLQKVFEIIDGLQNTIKNKIGAILLGSSEGNCSISEVIYGIFSGTLIKSEIALKTCCRDDFFVDQADHELYFKVRSLGYLTLKINCKLIEHRIGANRFVPIISNMVGGPVSYEPPWRYYYIVRNSTCLLIEGKLDFITYLKQLIEWGFRILLTDGFVVIKPLGLGILHALLGKLGYIDSRVFG